MSKGMTLIELMVTIAVVAILAAVAAPSMTDLIDRRRLVAEVEGVTALIETARSEVLKRSAGGGGNGFIAVTVSPGSDWYVGLSNSTDGCAVTTDCTINEGGVDVQRVWQKNVCDGCSLEGVEELMTFAFTMRGVLRAADNAIPVFTIESPKGNQLSVAVNALGRVTVCSPTGLSGYPSCS